MNSALSVGGITIVVEGVAPDLVPAPLQPFLTSDQTWLASCRGHHSPVELDQRERVLFDSGGIWRVDELSTGIRLVLRMGTPPGRPYHLLELNLDLDRGQILLDPRHLQDGPAPFLLRSPLHELWTCFMLLQGRGLLVHGCGLLRDGRVHLFLGESGAGKSTLAGVFEAHGAGVILSDDRLIIRSGESGYLVYGTPWQGEARFSSPECGILADVNFLGKAGTCSLRDLGPADAARRMFQSCFLAGWPRSGLEFLLASCAEVASMLPCREFMFRPDASILATLGFEGQS